MRVAVPDLISNSYFPVIAAARLGCWERFGLNLEFELRFPVTEAMAALRAGEYDFVAGTASSVVTAFPGWEGAKILMALSQRTYWLLVARADLRVPRGDLHAVRGLRIGAAPGVDTALRELLRLAGIDPERDVRIGPVPGSSASTSFGVSAAHALGAGAIDAFWANAMGAEVAVRAGTGSVVLDVRRGDGPPTAGTLTFPALVATDRTIEAHPDAVVAAIRGLVGAQRLLRDDPELATEAVRGIFPSLEAGLIAELVRRDLPYYDASVTPTTIAALGAFLARAGFPTGAAPFDRVVATQFGHLWREG